MSEPSHPIHRRYRAEDVVRLRRASEGRRFAGSQRQAMIDPNPHQIDAVMFALRRIPLGGCILADEVGLGKTIEAGLVIAQLLAEGAERILIIVPKPLLGQWQNELYDLFHIEAREASDPGQAPQSGGVWLSGREYAGTSAGFERLSVAPFDLCIIDEAHEMFAGIYRRYDRDGNYVEDSPYARTADSVRRVMGTAPVLLLTATPMQNSLAELWGLIQYVEPTGTLFGDMPTFVDVFCTDGDTRTVALPQANELRRRLGHVLQRTLRRQAQEFLEKPFVGRSAQLFEYTMGSDEKALYDDVTEYLLQPRLYAFDGRSRQLLMLGFHRRMASSTAALAESLDRLGQRLEKLIGGDASLLEATDDSSLLEDLEDDAADVADVSLADLPGDDRGRVEAQRAELELIKSFAARARRLGRDSKADSLITAVNMATRGGEKVVVFTESLTTQEYLRDLLLQNTNLNEADITLFRGDNNTPRAREALAAWESTALAREGAARPTPDVATRLALVHEFANSSCVMISTEAGAKGLNLQFCSTLINYDLPWNPQRIEQRIGRCHRYGQTRDVTVINFLATDNATQRLTHEILSTKLDLFGEVLDMSDAVLQTPRSENGSELATALGPEFEKELRRIWDRARSIEEVEAELEELRDNIEAQRQQLDDMRERTVGLIESRLDESVREVFRDISASLPSTLAEFDADLEKVLVDWLNATSIEYRQAPAKKAKRAQKKKPADKGVDAGKGKDAANVQSRTYQIAASPNLPAPLTEGVTVFFGQPGTGESLHAAHPLIAAAVAEARASGEGTFRVQFKLRDDASAALKTHLGSRGRLALTRVAYRGFEREDRLKVTAVFENADVLQPAAAAEALLLSPCINVDAWEAPLAVTPDDLDEVIDEELFFENSAVAEEEQRAFQAAMDQVEQSVEDRILVLRRRATRQAERLEQAIQKRDAALGSDARNAAANSVLEAEKRLDELETRIARLAAREDDVYARWKNNAHEKRYATPTAERLFEVEFEIT